MHFGKSNNLSKVSKTACLSARYFFIDNTAQKDKTLQKKDNSQPATQVLSWFEGDDTMTNYN